MTGDEHSSRLLAVVEVVVGGRINGSDSHYGVVLSGDPLGPAFMQKHAFVSMPS